MSSKNGRPPRSENPDYVKRGEPGYEEAAQAAAELHRMLWFAYEPIVYDTLARACGDTPEYTVIPGEEGHPGTKHVWIDITDSEDP